MNLAAQYDATLDRIWDYRGTDWKGRLAHVARLLFCTVRELASGELTLRAMSLVYTTLLSLVPLLALAFSILKGLGIHNRIEPMLAAMLQPLGPSASELTETVISFVDNVKIGVLGSVGIALLFYTVLAMIQKVEASFNFIWKIPRVRPLGQRISEYLVVLLLGPLALTLVVGTTASLSSNQVVNHVLEHDALGLPMYYLGRMLPYLVIVGIFSFLFVFIPNTRVPVRAALIGGLISGLMWQSAAWGFARFVAGSANYNAVYSSFAIIILLLIWLYLAWLILLTGCQISFFVRHPQYLTRHRKHRHPSGALRERLALELMSAVLERFVAGRPPMNTTELASQTAAPPDLVNPVIDELTQGGFLVETTDGNLLPGQDPDSLKVTDFLNAIGEDVSPGNSSVPPAVRDLTTRLRAARAEAVGNISFGTLVRPETQRESD